MSGRPCRGRELSQATASSFPPLSVSRSPELRTEVILLQGKEAEYPKPLAHRSHERANLPCKVDDPQTLAHTLWPTCATTSSLSPKVLSLPNALSRLFVNGKVPCPSLCHPSSLIPDASGESRHRFQKQMPWCFLTHDRALATQTALPRCPVLPISVPLCPSST